MLQQSEKAYCLMGTLRVLGSRDGQDNNFSLLYFIYYVFFLYKDVIILNIKYKKMSIKLVSLIFEYEVNIL